MQALRLSRLAGSRAVAQAASSSVASLSSSGGGSCVAGGGPSSRHGRSHLNQALLLPGFGAARPCRQCCCFSLPGSAPRRLDGAALPASTRFLATISRPQELHRHRKRLEGFGKDAPQGDRQTLDAAAKLLVDDDWFARKTAIDAIAKVAKPGDEVQLSLLYKHLEDEDIFVREACVDAVVAVARPEDDVALSKVSMRLADEDCFVRTRAVVGLGRLGRKGDSQTIALLDEMFEDGFVPVRKKAVESAAILAAPGDATVGERLRRCSLEDKDRGVRELAKEALARLASAGAASSAG